MKKKNHIILLLFLILVSSVVMVQARKRHPIPDPIVNGFDATQISPGNIVAVRGQGFIKGWPEAHQVWLIDSDLNYIRVRVLAATATELQILIPNDIALGDYDLSVKIQTKLLASRKSQAPQPLLIRPVAPASPKLNYDVIAELHEFDELLTETASQGHELFYELDDDIKIGINQVRAYYTQDSYRSIKSEPVSFHYLPKSDFENQLNIESESPLKSFAISKSDLLENGSRISYDVSPITQKETEDLSKSFYLHTPLEPRYLERTIKLKPLFIEAIHVLEPEAAIIRNRSNKDLGFSKCSLSDSLKEYFKFTTEKVLAHSSITINKNLGLNNTTPDSLIFTCNGEILDQFDYDKVDAAGLGIRI